MDFVGKWKSDSEEFENLIFNEYNEIWLLSSDGKTGTKWFYRFETSDKLVLYQPEDFIYQGGANYIYLQFTNPEKEIILTKKRID